MKTRKIGLSLAVATMMLTTLAAEDKVALDVVNVWETEVVSSSLNMEGTAIETKQASHLSDLLRNLPGVDVGGTHSINNRINIRGLQDENLDISLDGAKIQNANMFHHIGNLLINPDLLKKVEIDVGTHSVVNGSLGGSVAFETKDGEDLLDEGQNYGARIQATYNSNDSIGGSISGYGKVGEKGDFLIYHNHLEKNNTTDGTGEESFGVEGDVDNTLVKYGHKLSDSQKIIISYDRLHDEGDYSPRPDFGMEYQVARTGTATFPTEYERETVTLKHQLRLDNTTVDSTVYNNENELQRHEYIDGVTGVRPGYKDAMLIGSVKTTGANIKAQTDMTSGDILNTLTYGALYDKQSSEVEVNSLKYGDNEEAISTALYIEDAIDFNNGLVVTPGIRYNNYKYDGAYGEISDNEFTYSLASQYAITDSFTLLASATTLYKGVEMLEVLSSVRTATNDNESLKSETGINKEVGFKYIQNNTLGADSVGVLFRYFNTTINDYIGSTYNYDTYDYDMSNDGDLDLKGFELSFAYNKGDLNSLVTYARTETKFEDTGLATTTDPGDTISVNINYDLMSNLSLSWESLFAMDEKDTAGDEYNEKDSYNVHDIAVNYKPSNVKNLTVIAGVDNIFDEEYVSHISENRNYTISGVNVSTADYEPGRNIKVTLAYKF